MSKPVLVGGAIIAVVLALMVYSSMDLTSHRVEVCIAFKGETRCKTASGATEQNAIREAVENACGEMAGGVTETLACQGSEPTKLTILK